MQKETITTILLVAVITTCIGAIVMVDAMPVQVCTPEEIASILLQPTRDEMTAQKTALIEGEITEDEYIAYLRATKLSLEVKTVLLEAIRDSGRPYEEKMDLLFSVFPWNVRGGDSEVEVITYKSTGDIGKAQLVDSLAKESSLTKADSKVVKFKAGSDLAKKVK